MKNMMKHWRYCVSKASSQLNRLLHLRISSRRQRVKKSTRHFNFTKSAKCTAMPIDYSKFDNIGDSDEEPAAQRMRNTSNFVDPVQNDFRSLDQLSHRPQPSGVAGVGAANRIGRWGNLSGTLQLELFVSFLFLLKTSISHENGHWNYRKSPFADRPRKFCSLSIKKTQKVTGMEEKCSKREAMPLQT